jgi:uncharacterized membrane protein (UPF0127 family)
MAQLLHQGKILLGDMHYAATPFETFRGLMFADSARIAKGICLVMRHRHDVRIAASVTTFFCRRPLEILFVNSQLEVVDKVVLPPWRASYTPARPAKFIIESAVGSFAGIAPGEHVEIHP